MATFDDLRASRDRLLRRIDDTEQWLRKAYNLLATLDSRIGYGDLTLRPQTALLLQELNAELKRDNDEAEAK